MKRVDIFQYTGGKLYNFLYSRIPDELCTKTIEVISKEIDDLLLISQLESKRHLKNEKS